MHYIGTRHVILLEIKNFKEISSLIFFKSRSPLSLPSSSQMEKYTNSTKSKERFGTVWRQRN